MSLLEHLTYYRTPEDGQVWPPEGQAPRVPTAEEPEYLLSDGNWREYKLIVNPDGTVAWDPLPFAPDGWITPGAEPDHVVG